MFRIRLKQLRENKGISQSQLASDFGISQGTVGNWESGIREPNFETISKLANFFNVSVDYLLGNSDALSPSISSVKIPVLGSIPAGIPLEAIEDIIGEEEIPKSWLAGDKEFFALQIKGDSMEPEYRSGDIVIFRKQETCKSGDDCVVMINGNDATFKRVEKLPGGILIKPLNPNYQTLHFSDSDIEKTPVAITGVAWELRRTRRR